VIFVIVFSMFSMLPPQAKAESEVITLPAGAWYIAGRCEDSETILHGIDVDSATPGDQQIVYVSPGQTVSISYTFQMWSSGGPSIIKQALFAYSWASSWPPWDAYTPLYDGGSGGYYPGFYKTDTINIVVPLSPGEYKVWFASEAHYSMNLAMQGFTEPPTMLPHAIITVSGAPPSELYSLPAGAKHWVPSDPVLDETCMLFDLDIEGSGQVVYANPGQTLSGVCTFQRYSGAGNPLEIQQAFFIMSWTPSWPAPEGYYIPIYNGIPGVYPGITRTTSFSFTAPSTPGTYYLYWCRQSHYSMRQAVDTYDKPLTLPAHAKIVVGPPVVDWDGIKERANVRKQLYQLYLDKAFSPSWWEDTSDALVSQLYGGEKDSLRFISEILWESLKEILPSYVGILYSAYETTAGLIKIFSSLEALKYEIVADVLYQASLRYDVLADLAALVEKAELVAAAAEAHDLEALMDSLGQEKEAMEKLYQGTVEYEKQIWYYLATVPPPDIPGLGTYMNEHIYLMLVRYPYYYPLDREFTLDVRDGQLISLRSQLEANYLDVTNSLGDLNHLDEAVNAPLTTRYVAPLAERGYWTVNGEEKTEARAGDICTANVVLKPYDSMAVSGTVTVEILEKYMLLGVPYYEPFKTYEEQLELTPGSLKTISTPPFTADPPKNKPRFRGYHMNVKFSGEGIRNSDEEEGLVDVEVSWKEDPPNLRVPPAVVALFTLASPANLLVTAPDGLRVGYDPSTGTVVNEIEGATYSGPGTEPQMITIPYPLPGVYIVDIIGTGMGTYTLTMEFVAPDGSITTGTYTGEIVQGAFYVYTASLTYEEIVTSPNPTADLEHLKEFINGLPANSFDKPKLASQRKNALFNKIDEVILKVEAGNYTDAINKLFHDIRAKMDGNSTAKDWITDPQTQVRLCVIIDHIISSIETLQQA